MISKIRKKKEKVKEKQRKHHLEVDSVCSGDDRVRYPLAYIYHFLRQVPKQSFLTPALKRPNIGLV